MHNVDWLTAIGIVLLYAATAANVVSIFRRKTPVEALKDAVRACMRDKTGNVLFARYAANHLPREVEHVQLLRAYAQWREEHQPSLPLQMINDGVLMDMLIDSLPPEDTPPDDG